MSAGQMKRIRQNIFWYHDISKIILRQAGMIYAKYRWCWLFRPFLVKTAKIIVTLPNPNILNEWNTGGSLEC